MGYYLHGIKIWVYTCILKYWYAYYNLTHIQLNKCHNMNMDLNDNAQCGSFIVMRSFGLRTLSKWTPAGTTAPCGIKGPSLTVTQGR